MTYKKKVSLLTIGAYAGAIIACITLLGALYATFGDRINEKIDSRIDSKTKYVVILLKQIATDDQKRKADEEYLRWTTNK